MIKKTSAILILLFVFLTMVIPIKLNRAKEERHEIIINNHELINVVLYTRQDKNCEKVQAKEEKQVSKKYVCTWQNKSYKEKEFELLCRTVFCEAGNQDLQTQIMVALTILNRTANKKFSNTIKGVIYSKNAYAVTTWKDFENYKWTEQVEKAVNIALKNNNHPKDMFYFRTEHYHTFGKPYKKSDDLWFSTEN